MFRQLLLKKGLVTIVQGADECLPRIQRSVAQGILGKVKGK